jgi:hypothetical protein
LYKKQKLSPNNQSPQTSTNLKNPQANPPKKPQNSPANSPANPQAKPANPQVQSQKSQANLQVKPPKNSQNLPQANSRANLQKQSQANLQKQSQAKLSANLQKQSQAKLSANLQKQPQANSQIPKKMSFEEIQNIYNIICNKMEFPLNEKVILNNFHPYIFQDPLKEQIKRYSSIKNFVENVYIDMITLEIIDDFEMIYIILHKNNNNNLINQKEKSIIQLIKEPDENEKYHIYYILGLGNKEDDTLFQEYNILYYCNDDHLIKKVHIIVNSNPLSIVKNIVKTVCFMKPTPNTKIVAEIRDLLVKKEKVLVVGHSYGGAVAGCVAEEFNKLNKLDKDLLKNLQIATFGSIYISPNNNVSNINFKQYMMTNDIALKCNKLPKNLNVSKWPFYANDVTNNVTWIANDNDITNRWRIHNSYDYYMYNIFKTKNINLFS